MKKCLFTAVLFCSCTLAFNQTRLSGVAVDDKGEPFIGATVKLMKGTEVARWKLTDYEGSFVFCPIDPGTYNVEIVYPGYIKYRFEIVVVEGNPLNMGTITLSPCGICSEIICIFKPPIINQIPGNTGAEFTSNFIRNIY